MIDPQYPCGPLPPSSSNPVRTEIPAAWGGVLPRESSLTSGGGRKFENDAVTQKTVEGVRKVCVHASFVFWAVCIWIRGRIHLNELADVFCIVFG